MAALGPFAEVILQTRMSVEVAQLGITTRAMAALNTGTCFRFTATSVRDIYSVWVNWSSVSAAGVVTLRIETIDATTGKPSGSLYDANATLALAPVAGWQQYTFAVHPATGLVAGNEYAIVLLTTTLGTTQTLSAYQVTSTSKGYPAIALTAADGTTRSNFAEVSNSIPTCTIVYSDGSEECDGLNPFIGGGTTFGVYSTRAWGMKLVLSSVVNVRGVIMPYLILAGTPGNIQVQILDSTDAQVTGASVTVDKDSLLNVSGKEFYALFPGIVSLNPGTYRVIIRQTDTTTTSGNAWSGRAATARTASVVSSGMTRTDTGDVTVAHPTWTDTGTDQIGMGLILDDIPGTAPSTVLDATGEGAGYTGDVALGVTFDVKFATRSAAGNMTSLVSGTVAAYPDNSTTEITAGITLTADFDSRTGMHNVRVVATSGNGYATATNYTLILTAGTVGGYSAIGSIIGSFSIEARSALRPTTSGRTLDVAGTGEAGLDFDNIKQATGATTLTNIRVPNVTLTDTVTTYTGNTVQTGDSFGRLGVAGVGLTNLGDTRIANLDATVSSRTKPADTQAAVTTVVNLTNAPTVGDFTSVMKTSLNAATPASVTGAVASVTGNVGGNVVGSVGSVAGAVGSVTGNVGGNVTGSVGSVVAGVTLAASAVTAIWGALTSALTTAGSIGKFLVDSLTGNTPQTGDAYLALTGAQAEPGQGAPAVNASPLVKISYLYKFLRNRLTQTSTTFSVYDDAGTTVDQRASVGDDGVTFSRSEIISGP